MSVLTFLKKDSTHPVWFGMLLAGAGGMIDAYSFITRGGVFASGQTGNLVLLGYGIATLDTERILRSVIPILSFSTGILAAKHIMHFMELRNVRSATAKRRGAVMLGEAIALFLIGLIPGSVTVIVPNSLLSLLAAIQYCVFPHTDSGNSFSSVVITGNLRSFMEHVYDALFQKDQRAIHDSFVYLCILLSFLSGAVIEILAAGLLDTKAIWCCSLLFLAGTALVRKYL